MNRRGYVFLTGDPRRIPELEKEAEAVAGLGGGALRIHHDRESYVPSQPEGLQPDLTGADLVLDTETIARLFPFLTDDTAAMLHVRRCGWMDVPSLGRWMLDRIASRGGRIVRDRITTVDTRNNQVTSVRLASGSTIETGKLVLAAGPMVQEAGRMLDLDIPVFMELHGKIIVEDTAGILPPDAPMLIWTDPVELVWGRPTNAGDTPPIQTPAISSNPLPRGFTSGPGSGTENRHSWASGPTTSRRERRCSRRCSIQPIR